MTVQPKDSTKTNSNPKTKSKQKSQSQSQSKQQPGPTTISQTQEQTQQLQKINFRKPKPKPKPKISKVKREMREKFLYLISSGHQSNKVCHKCSPPDRATERDSSGHRSNEACRNRRSEIASERKRESCDRERGREKKLCRGS